MKKMVEWSGPWFGDDDSPELIMRMTEADAIRAQRQSVLKSHGWMYLTDKDALDDFIAVRWARQIEVFE